MATAQRCQVCSKGASALEKGQKLLCCSRCKNAFYCSAECQRADWKTHKKDCKAVAGVLPAKSLATTSKATEKQHASSGNPDASKASLLGSASEMDNPCWGGPLVSAESSHSRLQRVVKAKTNRRYFSDRFAKARELFRLGFNLYLEQQWEHSVTALAEALLLEEKAMPQALAEVQLSEGPSSCPFGSLVRRFREVSPTIKAASWPLQLVFLEMHWMDMQMIFTRELCARHQDDPEVASEHQSRWFELLCSMDDLARKAIAAHGGNKTSDSRLLSRLILVQAQYGPNPPLSRPSSECTKLAIRAVELWPEDPMARLWCARKQDLVALEGVLEPDSPHREKLKKRLQVLESAASPKVEEIHEEEDDSFKITGDDFVTPLGGDFVVLDGDHTEKDYCDIVSS